MPVATTAGSPSGVKMLAFMSPVMMPSEIESAMYTSRASSTMEVILCWNTSSSSGEIRLMPSSSRSDGGSIPRVSRLGSRPGALPYGCRS